MQPDPITISGGKPVKRGVSFALFVTAGTIAVMLAGCGGAAQAGAPAGDAGEAAESAAEAPPADFSCSPTGSEPIEYEAPQQVIREGHDYVATLTLENGQAVTIDLFPEAAPITVNNFVFLACQGFYDGTTFHRVLPGFVAQGGDPTGTGAGGPGYTIEHEADNGLLFDRPGLVSMAHRMSPHTTGSQFFITYDALPTLDDQFTVFGEVTDGMAAVEALTPRDPENEPNAPPGDVIASIRVAER